MSLEIISQLEKTYTALQMTKEAIVNISEWSSYTALEVQYRDKRLREAKEEFEQLRITYNQLLLKLIEIPRTPA